MRNRQYKFSVVGVIDGKVYQSSNNTREEFEGIVKMIYAVGGFVLEFTQEEIMKPRPLFGA